jgi:hypothetical protein
MVVQALEARGLVARSRSGISLPEPPEPG